MGVEHMYRSCLRGDSAIPPRAKKAYHYNTMPCLPIRHASTLTYGLYYRYQRANKVHEWKMRSKCEVCFNITGHYHATVAVTTLRHASFNGIQKWELVLKWYQRQFAAAA